MTVSGQMVATVQLFNPDDAGTLTAGTGWVRQTANSTSFRQTTPTGTADDWQVATFVKTYTGTPGIGSTETVCTWTGSALFQVMMGEDLGGFGVDTSNTFGSSTPTNSFSAGGVTTAEPNGVVMALCFNDNGLAYSTPSGWASVISTGGFALFTKTFSSAGATGSQAFATSGGATADHTVTMIAILATALVPAANPAAAFFAFFGRPTGGAGGGTAQPGLHVVTTSGAYQLLDGLGNQFNARGVAEYSIFDDHNGGGTAEWTAIDTTVAAEKANGVNLVRQRILGSYYNSLSSANKTAYITQIESRLAKAKAQGAILLLEPWDPYYLAASFATAYASLYPVMADVQAAIGNDSSLIWGTGNEPNDASTGSLTWTLWQTAQEGIIANLVSAGYTGVILVDPINWANSGANGDGFNDTAYTAIETYHAGLLSAHHGILFSAHQYWWPGWSNNGTPIAWSLTRFLNTVLGGTTTHCILLSELGYDNDTAVVDAGIDDTWQAAIVADLSTLASTMKNFAGVSAFASAYNLDDNRLFLDSDKTTLTNWGQIFFAGGAPPTPTLTITNAEAVLQMDDATVVVSATLSSDLVNAIITDSTGAKLAADDTPDGSGNVSWTLTGLPVGANVITITAFNVAAGMPGGSPVAATVSVTVPPPAPSGTLTITNAKAVLQSDNTTVVVTATLTTDLINGVVTNSSGSKVSTDVTPDGSGNASWTITGLPSGVNVLTVTGFTVAAGQPGGASATATVTVTVGAPSSTKLIVGINSLMNHNYITGLVAGLHAIGINSDRIELSSSDTTEVSSALSAGLTKSLVLYNRSQLSGVSAATAVADCNSIVTFMQAHSLTLLEFGNEVYFTLTPQQYAALYHAVHAALVGKGITLICCGAVANNTGSNASPTWINQVIAALPGGAAEVDAWAIHPYGSMTTNVVGSYGWANLAQARAIAVAAGSNAPFYVTEVGQSIGNTPVATSLPVANATIQGQDVAQYFRDALADGYVRGVWIYTCVDDGTGQFGITTLTNTSTSASFPSNARPAMTAIQNFIAANPGNVQ